MPVERTAVKKKEKKKSKSPKEILEKKKQKLWFQNMIALKFPVMLMAEKHKIAFHDSMFDVPNKNGFEVVCNFLFSQLDQAKASELIKFDRGYDKKMSHQFRTVCINWWRQISEEYPSFNIPRVSMTLLMSPAGTEFYRILFSFSTFVLYSVTKRLEGKGESCTLLPVIPGKEKRIEQAQKTVLKNATRSQILETMHLMQASKQTDHKAEKLAESLLQEYREGIKKKKHLEQRKMDLQNKLHLPTENNTCRTPSRYPSSAHTPQKNLQAQTNQSLLDVRRLWKKLLDTAEATEEQQNVILSILTTEKGSSEISANKLATKIPAALLQKCTHQVYENVGTSLYEAGRLNLGSLLKLFNLSLHLIIEKLHEAGVPNFENQVQYVGVQSRICEKNSETLKHMSETLRQIHPETEKEVHNLTVRLDEIYLKREQDQQVLISGLPQPKFQSTVINEENSKLGVLPPTPPFRFMEANRATPVLMPENWTPMKDVQHAIPLLHDLSSITAKVPVVDLPQTSPPVNHLSENMEASEEPNTFLKQGKLEIGPSPKTTRKKQNMGTQLQHMALRKKLTEKRTALPRPIPRYVEGNSKASSLPSTPVAKTQDTTIEKVKTRTPEAVRNLVDQVVDYTMMEMSVLPGYIPSETTPADEDNNPAFFDIASQLDATVFQSTDKIERTPPTSFVHDYTSPIVLEKTREGDKSTNESISQSPEDFSSSFSSCDYNGNAKPLNSFATPIAMTHSVAANPAPSAYLTPSWSKTLADIDLSKHQNIMDDPCPDLLTAHSFLDFSFADEPDKPVVAVGNLIDL